MRAKSLHVVEQDGFRSNLQSTILQLYWILFNNTETATFSRTLLAKISNFLFWTFNFWIPFISVQTNFKQQIC